MTQMVGGERVIEACTSGVPEKITLFGGIYCYSQFCFQTKKFDCMYVGVCFTES